MYENHWGMTTNPFVNSGESLAFYEGNQYAEALARLYFLVEQRRRCGILNGPPEVGKTLLLQVLDQQLQRSQRHALYMDLTSVVGNDFVRQLAELMGIDCANAATPYQQWQSVRDSIYGSCVAGLQTVVLIDQLEHIDARSMRWIEALLRLETGECDCLTVVLSCRSAKLSQLSLSIMSLNELHIAIGALDREETFAYIRTRLNHAQCERHVFEADALNAVHEMSGGIPGRINCLCDHALIAAMGYELQSVTGAVVQRSAVELGLSSALHIDEPHPTLAVPIDSYANR